LQNLELPEAIMDDGDELPDDAFVVRGGLPPFVRSLTLACDWHPQGFFGFSVQAEASKSVVDLARAVPNGRVGFTTVGEIRKMGYDVVRTSGAGFHATLVVPIDWDEAEAERLARLFQEADNPNPRRVR
jgi:hypothetical protein